MHRPTADRELISVIVRFHDLRRQVELDRALFSLANQTYRGVEAIIVLQDLSDHVYLIRKIADKFDWAAQGHAPPIVCCLRSNGTDSRSKLLNLGIAKASGRYLAVLDCDDYIYSYAYEHLLAGLRSSEAVISFGDIIIKYKHRLNNYVCNLGITRTNYSPKSYADLLYDNFCPIHSFLADRDKIGARDLMFNENLTRLEDYDFFLRVCSKYISNFKTREKVIGVYNYDICGDNSVMNGIVEPSLTNYQAWSQARRHIWRLKSKIRDASRTCEGSAAAMLPELVQIGAAGATG